MIDGGRFAWHFSKNEEGGVSLEVQIVGFH